ncbi:MAG: twin-arginine translocation signal domain-containing protein, partial [bacterium]
MNRREFLKNTGAAALAFGLGGCMKSSLAAGGSATRPNIILCMTDDQGWWDTSYYGLKKIKTP